MNTESNDQTIQAGLPINDMRLWQRLVFGLRNENRFTLDSDTEKFVAILIKYAGAHKTKILPQDTLLFRARINDPLTPFPIEEMGAPTANIASQGRLNPNGIPYLYLASNEITAASEVRPWAGCDLTIAEFTLSSDCELINFSNVHFVNRLEGEEFKGSEFTWRELIVWMFSKPVDPKDDTAYVPTQFLAERIKGAGFDGIIHDSALSSDGYNVTLFDVNAAKPVRRQKGRVKSVNIEAEFEGLAESEAAEESTQIKPKA